MSSLNCTGYIVNDPGKGNSLAMAQNPAQFNQRKDFIQ